MFINTIKGDGLMNLNDVLSVLEEYKDPQGRLSVLFINKEGVKYKSFKPEISNDVQEDVLELFIDYIKTIIVKELDQVEFNHNGQLVDQYSVCSYNYVGNFDEVIQLYDNPIETEMSADEINYLVYRLRINKDGDPIKYLYIFRRNHKLKNIRKGFWIRKISEIYNKLDSDLIGIDGIIDAIAYDGELAFFSHISAERIFNLREQYAQNAKMVLKQIEEGKTIENFHDFKEDCLNDARVTRRLTKIQSNPEIIKLYHEKFSNAEEVINLFDLSITLSGDKTKIIYNDKDQLKDITMLMRDAYYRTVLLNRKGVDEYS